MADSFSEHWLNLRAEADHAARNRRLHDRVRRWAYLLQQRRRDQPLQIVDLGCGSGANLCYLTPYLGRRQRWLLLDHDAQLLNAAATRLEQWGEAQGFAQREITPQRRYFSSARQTIDTTLQQLDLRRMPEDIWPAQLITASALLDLTSADWLRRLARDCRRHNAALLMTLSYSGGISWTPQDPFDRIIEFYFDRHQRSDKTFGRALGPDAVRYLAACLRRLGYRVSLAASPWRLDTGQQPLQQELLKGFSRVLSELQPQAAQDIGQWLERRHAALPDTILRVEHVDLFAWLEHQ